MEYEEKYMYRCLQLAAYGNGYVAPNPMVGAVVVHNNMIIGEGYHRQFGEAHAEPNAIQAVKDERLLPESTLYVNLEPCSHYGKTPPCANLIINKKIPRVIIGTVDPNPKVSGRGIEMMRQAGIEVVVGVLEDACNELNKRFFTWQKEKRPYVMLKWAQTRDGFLDKHRASATTLPLQISHKITKQFTHKIRSENQSILVGTNTVMLDNPSLTVRNWAGKDPIRIILDRQGVIPTNYQVLDNRVKTIIFTSNRKQDTTHTQYIEHDFGSDSLTHLFRKIAALNIHSVLVEGGSKLLHSIIKEGLWDEANVEVSNQIIYNGIPAPILGVAYEKTTTLNQHTWTQYINKKNIPM